MLEILLVAVSLSMDAFAVSVSAVACSKNLSRAHMLRAAFAFGLFQFLMPLAGWFLGSAASGLIGGLDHWIAFALLAFVGGKMLAETFLEWKENPDASCALEGDTAKRDLSSKRIVFLLAIATSIDALAVGISFAVIGKAAFVPSLMIGGVTFVICSLGFFFGKKAGLLLGRYAQLAGGIVLIAIGVKILASHLSLGV
jgi:manganese efflux pump family protein